MSLKKVEEDGFKFLIDKKLSAIFRAEIYDQEDDSSYISDDSLILQLDDEMIQLSSSYFEVFLARDRTEKNTSLSYELEEQEIVRFSPIQFDRLPSVITGVKEFWIDNTLNGLCIDGEAQLCLSFGDDVQIVERAELTKR